jgi:hypothetical protein
MNAQTFVDSIERQRAKEGAPEVSFYKDALEVKNFALIIKTE